MVGSKAPKHIFHLIANAHLDPVWLWDWREGLNEGIITCRTILDLMDEFHELTFVRGEAAVYKHIEEHDPPTFTRILRYVRQGRWDVIGGTMVQPDTNLPTTETFARHFAHGQGYFKSRFGRIARVAWAADSFGHSAGLPEVMAEAGITGFAFTRPTAEALPLARQAFWWEGPGGSRVLGYRPSEGWYGTERDEVPRRLDACLAAAQRDGLCNVGVFYGLGNHGGGPSRRHLREISRWAQAHPEIQVVHSGLHRLFDDLREEISDRPADTLSVHRGELNFTLRGCYASVARFKFAYRKTEAALAAAEKMDTAVHAVLGKPFADLSPAWDALLFNSFHDLLPGSSIERAFDEQLAWLGGAFHTAQEAEMAAINALVQDLDTHVQPPVEDAPAGMPFLVWNPHPWPFRGHVEWEANMDYRPIYQYKGRAEALPMRVLDPHGNALPHQAVPTENSLGWDVPWRKRVVVPVELPPLGWSVFEFAWVEGAVQPSSVEPWCTALGGQIDNGVYRVQARKDDTGIQVFHRGRSVFGDAGLSAIVVEDPFGSWGGPDHGDATNLSSERECWRIADVQIVEQGPERALLWVRLGGQRSHLDLSFHLYRGREAVDVDARLLWNERQARLKLVMPVGLSDAEFEVPGASIRRAGFGEVPGGSWVRAFGNTGSFGFASDALYCFDSLRGALRATVARASGYAMGETASTPPWRPPVDCGELKFRFLMNPGNSDLPRLAQALQQPPSVFLVPAKAGRLPRTGSIAALDPSSLRVLALKEARDAKGLVLRVQELEGRATNALLHWMGETLSLGTVNANAIATWRIRKRGAHWTADRCSILEERVAT